MKINKNDIFSRTSYFVVRNISQEMVEVTNTKNLTWQIGKNIIENECISAINFTKEEMVSKTKICEILESTNGAVFTVTFSKQIEDDYIYKTLQDLYPNKGKIVSKEKFDRSVKSIIKNIKTGEKRVLTGHLIDSKQEFGRYKVIDLEIQLNDSSKHSVRQVDSKTIEELIFNNVKYKVK